MKAKEVLKIMGITRPHLCQLVKQGKIGVTRQPNGYYVYNAEDVYRYVGKKHKNLNVIYARVSTNRQKTDLARQIDGLSAFCLAQGIKVDHVFSDVASGINFDKRKQFFTLLDLVIDGQVEKVVVNYKDRLSRVGFDLFNHLFLKFGTEIVVANGYANERLDNEEIMNEIITLIHGFSTRHYSKMNVKRAIKALEDS
jgi:predicted site-specific integrase-resolvase